MSSSPISSSSSSAPEMKEVKSPFDTLGALRCPVTVTLGTGLISVRQCLGLAPDSILRLAESAGNDLRVNVNGITIARGEVALIDTSTAIRVTELAPSLPGKRTT
jgi:flagellar motor switch/type III secretory pathway protein FliN